MLRIVKSIHTLIWLVMTGATILLFRAVLLQSFDLLFYISLGLILAEIIVLTINGWVCPLTPLAARYTDNRSDNFDIYLPGFMARYNKQIYSVILALILITQLYQTMRGSR